MNRYLSTPKKNLCLSIILLFIGSVFLSSCNLLPIFSETKENYPEAEIVFQVFLPSSIPQDSKLVLEIVDDVTGLAFNPTRYEMTQQDDKTYFVKLPLVIGSVIKYRYIRQSNVSTVEFSPQGNQIRFRMASITGPAIFQDSVSAWIDQKYNGPLGRVTGQLFDSSNNAPIPNLLVSADGIQSTTSSDGTFILEGLTPGTHNFVAYSMDGLYATFQQGVLVSDGANTPVVAALTKRPLVNVSFNVTLPEGFTTDYPLRMVTNLQSLGNAYTDLASGSTTIPSSLPVLEKKSSNKYSISLVLPAGFDLRYKFTLGDGLWNSELNSTGSFILRQLLVPNKDQTINNNVATFTTPGFSPVSFELFSTVAIPSDENVFIQFNPFGWFEPIPMLKVSESQWEYTLYSPMNILGPVEYRFCRNTLCEQTSAIAKDQQVFSPSSSSQSFSIKVDQWTNLQNYQLSPDQIITDGDGIVSRVDFVTGFEIDKNYFPSGENSFPNGLSKVISEGSNFVVISSTWTATRNDPPLLESLPGKDKDWYTLVNETTRIRNQGIQVAIFPQIRYLDSSDNFWSLTTKTGWLKSWSDRYQRYLIFAADLANVTGANAIIIGDPSVEFSGNTTDNWEEYISTIRNRYKGKILAVVPYPSSIKSDLSWMNSVDGIYVLYSPSLSQSSSVTTNELINLISSDLQKNLHTSLNDFNKPIYLSLNYPSAENALAGCSDQMGSCMNNWGTGSSDLTVQLRIYNAAIIAAAKENWINGFIVRNFNPYVVIDDNSSSINGKPAMDILWFWFHLILNKTS